jgi:hypothetical protein
MRMGTPMAEVRRIYVGSNFFIDWVRTPRQDNTSGLLVEIGQRISLWVISVDIELSQAAKTKCVHRELPIVN